MELSRREPDSADTRALDSGLRGTIGAVFGQVAPGYRSSVDDLAVAILRRLALLPACHRCMAVLGVRRQLLITVFHMQDLLERHAALDEIEYFFGQPQSP